MITDEQSKKYLALNNWFKSSQGKPIAQAFSSELQKLNFLKGKHLLQLGSCGDNAWLSSLNFQQKWLISPCKQQADIACYSSINQLPFDRNSLDCVIAPLTLEIFSPDKTPIEEIDRILKPGGYLVYFGINVWSLWGLALCYGSLASFAKPINYFSPSLALKHTMLHRNYHQLVLQSFYFIPPVKHPTLIYCLDVLNEMGKMLWPLPPGFFCLVMQKTMLGVTPLSINLDEAYLARV